MPVPGMISTSTVPEPCTLRFDALMFRPDIPDSNRFKTLKPRHYITYSIHLPRTESSAGSVGRHAFSELSSPGTNRSENVITVQDQAHVCVWD